MKTLSPESACDASPPAPVGSAAPPWETVRLRGVPFAAATEAQVIRHVLDELARDRGGWIITANLDILRRMKRDGRFHDLARGADFLVADGMPLVWASRLQATPLPERVAGSTMTPNLAGAAAAHKRSLYLLGGNPGAAAAAARVLQERYRGLVIAGTDCPPLGFERSDAEVGRIRDALVAAAPDIVYVALGSPKQERLIARLRPSLPGAWWIGVGVSLSFLSGEIRRAPGWAQQLGLEWAHRLIQEPGRLGRRYLVDGAPFGLRLLAGAAAARVIGPREPRGGGGVR